MSFPPEVVGDCGQFDHWHFAGMPEDDVFTRPWFSVTSAGSWENGILSIYDSHIQTDLQAFTNKGGLEIGLPPKGRRPNQG